MDKGPVISVIVPSYNHELFLRQRLESIFQQTYQNFEVILLDDASTDKSIELLKGFASNPKVTHLIKNKINSGCPFKQWKKGVGLSRGEYIWIAESDDCCSPLFLENVIKFIEDSSFKTELVYTQSLDINENDSPIGNRVEWTSEFHPNIWNENFVISGDEFIKKYLKVKNVIPNASAVVFKKSLLHQGSFPQDLVNMRMCGDWYFWLKNCSKTTIGFIAKPLNYFREHSNSSRKHITRDRKIMRLQEEGILRSFLSQEKPEVDQQEEFRKLYKKWFILYSLRDLLNWKFYKIISIKNHYSQFFSSFLKTKTHES